MRHSGCVLEAAVLAHCRIRRFTLSKEIRKRVKVALWRARTAPVTHEILREVEPEPKRRPIIHVGGR
jgi:hypothetical protein